MNSSNNPESPTPKNEKKRTLEEWTAALQEALKLSNPTVTIRKNPPQQSGETTTRFIFLSRPEDKKE
jgi:hypothetical protein